MLDARNVAALRDGLLRRAASTFIFAFLQGSALFHIGALAVPFGDPICSLYCWLLSSHVRHTTAYFSSTFAYLILLRNLSAINLVFSRHETLA